MLLTWQHEAEVQLSDLPPAQKFQVGLKLAHGASCPGAGFFCVGIKHTLCLSFSYSLFTVLTVQESKSKSREDTDTRERTLCATRVEFREGANLGPAGKVSGNCRLDRRKDDLSKGARRQKNLRVGFRGWLCLPIPCPPPAQQRQVQPFNKTEN